MSNFKENRFCMKKDDDIIPLPKHSPTLYTHLLLLVQASIGAPLATIGIYTSESVTTFNWFCIVVFIFDIVTIMYSFLHIIDFIFGKKSEYEDIEKGGHDESNYESFEITRKLQKMKKENKSLKKINEKLIQKQKECEELKKTGKETEKSLYGGYGYCNYGHYHKGAPVK